MVVFVKDESKRLKIHVHVFTTLLKVLLQNAVSGNLFIKLTDSKNWL